MTNAPYNGRFVSRPTPEPVRVLLPSEHRISPRDIAPGALKVMRRLERAGFEGCVVGGGVRDLLLGRRPKDFDVATNARPEQVRRLFRNSRVIGRRFRLVHVLFPEGMVEVATFRSSPDPSRQRSRGEELLVTSDNTYGTPQQDAFRRDFTINALFYRLRDGAVIDYVGGLEDLDRQLVRVIGEPAVRMQEDPVRMLRACEFAGRLGFSIDGATRAAIRSQRLEIDKASRARLTEEVLELLSCGRAEPALLYMLELRLLDRILPQVRDLLSDRGGGEGFSELIATVDRWIQSDRALPDELLLAATLAPQIIHRRQRLEGAGRAPGRGALDRLAEQAIVDLGKQLDLSRARSDRIVDILCIFQRLCEPPPEDAELDRLVRRSAFADALDLFELLTETSGAGTDGLEEWRRLRREALQRPPAPGAKRRPRKRRRRPRKPKEV